MPIKKYSKVKFTLRKELIIILAVAVVMLVTTILLQLPTKSEKFYKEWRNAGSQRITEDSIYKTTSFDKLDDILEGSKGYVYVYYADSSNQTAVGYFDLIIEYAELADADCVYIIDSSFAKGDREEDADLDKKLTDIETKFGIKLEANPSFFTFKDGEKHIDLGYDYKDLIETSGNWNEALKRALLAPQKTPQA